MDAKSLQSYLDYPLTNPYIMAIVKITLVLYASSISPVAPSYLHDALKNTFVKIVLIALMVYFIEKDLQLGLLIAIIYVIGMNLLAGRGALESFENYASYNKEYKSDGKFKLIEPKTMIYPGCLDITMTDLEEIFKGDISKMP